MDSPAKIVVLAHLLACKPGDDQDSTRPEDETGNPSGDSAAGEPWSGVVEHVPDAIGISDFMYELDEVYALDLTISEEGYSALSSSPYEYVEGTVTLDGSYLGSIGIRLMGRYGSYREMSGKPSFKLSFNEFVPGQNFFGLEKMNIKNMVTDYSQIHDVMGYAVHNASGVPAPRVGYVWVTLNGADYGLYANIEPYEEHFLQRHFDDPTGNLYDGDYFLFDTGGYTLVDFSSSMDDYFQLDLGEDVGLADIEAITNAVAETGGTDAYYERLDELLNWEEFLRFWAVEQWLCAPDSYNYNQNNYRVYFDKEDGKAQLFPWDQDSIYYSAITLTSTSGVLSSYCQSDPDCMEHMYKEVDHVCTVVDNMGLEQIYARTTDLIQPYVDADPRREVGTDTIAYYQSLVSTWITSRSATVRATWGIE